MWNSEIWFLTLFESTDNGTQTKQQLIKITLKKKEKHTDVMTSPSKLCPPYPTRIWKRSFVSAVRLSCTDTNLSRKRSLSKTVFKPEKFENNGFAEAFRKWWHYDNCKMAGYCCFFKFLRCSVDGKQVMCCRVQSPFSNSQTGTGPKNLALNSMFERFHGSIPVMQHKIFYTVKIEFFRTPILFSQAWCRHLQPLTRHAAILKSRVFWALDFSN